MTVAPLRQAGSAGPGHPPGSAARRGVPGFVQLVVIAVGVAGGLLARRRLRVVVVDGSSMAPTYADGDRLLVVFGGRRLAVRLGDIVVARAPSPAWSAEQPLDEAHVRVVKRVTAVGGTSPIGDRGGVPSGTVFLEGDAPGGYDSKVFGPLARSEVLGRVLRPLAGRRTLR